MDYTSVSELVDFSSVDGALAPSVNAYLRHGWTMLACCTQSDEAEEHQCVYVLLGWFGSEKAPHLHTDFKLND